MAESRKRIPSILSVLFGLVLCLPVVSCGPAETERAKPISYPQTSDDFVTPGKIFPYDLKSAAKELVGKTVWVRTGNAFPYYRCDSTGHSADLAHKAGMLPSLDKLLVKDVIVQKAPILVGDGQVAVVRRAILAVFERVGTPDLFAVPIGSNMSNDFTFTVNDVFFYEDPHTLYNHWSPDVWSAIDQHQAKKGMNELQTGFALGKVTAAGSGDYGNRWVRYGGQGSQVKVVFVKNQATDVTQ
jgi:hypothetical protein